MRAKFHEDEIKAVGLYELHINIYLYNKSYE